MEDALQRRIDTIAHAVNFLKSIVPTGYRSRRARPAAQFALKVEVHTRGVLFLSRSPKDPAA